MKSNFINLLYLIPQDLRCKEDAVVNRAEDSANDVIDDVVVFVLGFDGEQLEDEVELDQHVWHQMILDEERVKRSKPAQ